MRAIGPYELLEELGRGGAGAVFRARDTRSERLVALKVLLSGRDATPTQRTRFEREARALARVDHRSVVRLLDVGDREGTPYLVLEYHPLGTLLAMIERDLLTPYLAAFVGAQLAAGLEAAHALGVLHRDIKPANVLINDQGQALLTDFGLAKHLDRIEMTERLTRTGAFLGTPGFCAPEQTVSAPDAVSPAVDVYGLGATLYAALSGRAPAEGETVIEIAVATREVPPTPITTLRPDVAPSLAAIIHRCLEKDPQRRFPSATALKAALRKCLDDGPGLEPSAAPVAPPNSRTAVALLGLVAFLIAVLLIAVVVRSPTSTTGVAVEPAHRPLPPSPPATTSVAANPSGAPAPKASAAKGQRRWFAALPADKRPPLPLPPGITISASPGDYLNEKDGTRLRWIPAGSFLMGDDGRRPTNTLPQHRVTFATGFFLGKFETTWTQYRAFCAATNRAPPSNHIDYTIGGGARINAPPNHPVFRVTWHDAIAYSRWAGLRLPSEAEWAFAARGPEQRRYPWGDSPPTARHLNIADRSTGWDFPPAQKLNGLRKANFDDGYPFTAPGGRFPAGATPTGCHNMAGNLSEWVQDTYAPDYRGASSDGAPRLGEGEHRTIRGSAWAGEIQSALAARRAPIRLAGAPDHRIGFRVARSAR